MRGVKRVVERFLESEAKGGLLLFAAALVAFVLSNSPWAQAYFDLRAVRMELRVGEWTFGKTLLAFVNDFLMAFFFLLVGLELKRELVQGELENPKQAGMAVAAALGGMVTPAAIYTFLNAGTEGAAGWGVPMATDIAFALGTLALLGSRIPKSLLTFLVALAIVDDLGAVLVIALFYTETLSFTALMIVAFVLFLLLSLNLGGICRPTPYILLGIVLWIAMLKSGVHATLAGILLAFTIPMRPKYEPARFLQHINEMVGKIKAAYQKETNIIKNDELRSRVRALGEGVNLVQAPAQIMERSMHLPSAYIIIPIFSLANAGIPIDFSVLVDVMSHPVAMGVTTGLVLGKLLGIAGFTWIAVKLGIATLPRDLNFRHIIGVGLMGGIGFTMSIFIAELGFAGSAHELLMAKTGILFASLIAGLGGFIWLYFSVQKITKENG